MVTPSCHEQTACGYSATLVALGDFMNVDTSACHFVSAPCGSGKSWAACQFIAEQAEIGQNFVYVAPTIKLLKEIEERLQQKGVATDLITSETHPKVLQIIVKYLKGTREGIGRVLLITHRAYFQIPYFHRREHWQVIIDEVPQVDEFKPYRLPRTGGLLTQHLMPCQTFENSVLMRLVPKDHDQLDRYLEQRDDCEDVLRGVFMDALSPSKDVFITRKSWAALNAAGTTADVQVPILSMLNGAAFKDTVLLGAELEHSLLYRHLQNLGVEFKPHKEIRRRLRYTNYPDQLGKRLMVEYYIKDRSYSKSLRDSKGPDGRTVGASMDDALTEAVGSDPFLLVCNKDYQGRLPELGTCTLIPTISHGLNAYEDATTLVFMAALNRKPDAIRMLAALGLSMESIRRSTVYEILHQAVMRTNLRVADSTKPVRVIVPDRFSSDFLVDLFGTTNVKHIAAPHYQVRAPALSGSQRKQRLKYKQAVDAIFAGQHAERNSISSMRNRSRRNRSTAPPPANLPMLMLTLQKDRFAQVAAEFRVLTGSAVELVDALKWCASTVQTSKDKGELYQLTEFDPTRDPRGYRRQKNFKASYGLILDFDNGSLSPAEFERLFWHGAPTHRWSFMICNSFSRSSSAPNKFRVVFPFAEPATSLMAYQIVYDGVVEVLTQAGISTKEAELDSNCRSGTQAFFLPCTNQAEQEHAFFRSYGLASDEEFARHGLRPNNMIVEDEEVAPRTRRVFEPSSAPINSRAQGDLAARAQLEKHAIQSMSEGRHRPFFDGARRLRDAGMPLDDVRQWAEETAGNDTKLLRKVPGIMASLGKSEARARPDLPASASASTMTPALAGAGEPALHVENPQI